MRSKVLFIGGCGRSGSTLLARILGNVPGFLDVGELRFIWKAGLQRNIPCGCGTTFRECEFWSGVVADALGDVPAEDVPRFRDRQHRVERILKWPAFVRPFLKTPCWRKNLREYAPIMERVLAAALARSGCRVIVDSSKLSGQGLVLSAGENVDLHLVHLLRDPRAMAFSWRRQKETVGPGGQKAMMNRLGYIKSARYWNRENRNVAALSKGAASYTWLRYEDLMREPGAELRRILAATGDGDADLSFLAGDEAHLAPTHSISGNPMRFESGPVKIRADAEWREKLNPWGRRIVSALTCARRAKYGYGSDAVADSAVSEPQ